ncbi:MAG: dihydroneopterin aldolase [Verrucomicrobia bacterium]|nr:dihydroneopterin aldolase [Verrucomicrobiota bacterium]
MNPPDTIEIRRLRVLTHIGVSAAEREPPQALFITVRMVPSQGFEGLADELARTVDYAAVVQEIEVLAGLRCRRLLETLALEIAAALLAGHPLGRVAVTIEKHILPNTECVAVHLERER